MRTCDEWSGLLDDAVDDALSAGEARALREHCARCARCGGLLRDLRAIREAAGALDRHTPAPRLWRAIASRTVSRHRVPGVLMRRALAAAAVLLLVAGAAGWRHFASRPASGAPAEAAMTADAEIREAEAHYMKAIAALEQLTAGQERTLDPRVAEAIGQSLATIDRAIAESRSALIAHPESAVAQASLLEALRMKVSLLQQTVSLVNVHS